MKPHRHKTPAPAKGPAPMQLEAAYSVCRSISRAAARNFYYSFLALPREKRDAICAVYAFMRHADDLCDEPGLSLADKRARLGEWLERLHRAIAGEATDEPVLLALSDAHERYDIPIALLDQLVAGTAMDLDEPAEAAPRPAAEGESKYPAVCCSGCGPVAAVMNANRLHLAPRYATFADLYEYCYHVASVVGLICIRIFGYRDPSAEPLAEHCGIAFQVTNIVRDVKEDAAMGRVYLPAEDLQRFGRSAGELENISSETAAQFRPLLEFEVQRARDFYASGEELLPLIDEDSRPALWVLVTIYRRLLEKIAARNYDVFGDKIRLTTLEKLRVLAKGLWLRLV